MGTVLDIYIAEKAGALMERVDRVDAVAGRGLAGDRYFEGTGSFSRWPGSGRAISMIEKEVLDAIYAERGIDLRTGQSRRNLVIEGEALAGLNGRRFRIGTTILRGVRLCAPCRYLERLVGAGTFAAIKGRGGLRADILESGLIRSGDKIEII
jgi:MOSC domain-containing protein YiiM